MKQPRTRRSQQAESSRFTPITRSKTAVASESESNHESETQSTRDSRALQPTAEVLKHSALLAPSRGRELAQEVSRQQALVMKIPDMPTRYLEVNDSNKFDVLSIEAWGLYHDLMDICSKKKFFASDTEVRLILLKPLNV